MSASERNLSTTNPSTTVSTPPTTVKTTPLLLQQQPQTPVTATPKSFFPPQSLPGQGIVNRPVFQPQSVSDRSVCHPRPVIAYYRRPIVSNHMDPMGNLIRPVHPQQPPPLNHLPHLGLLKSFTDPPQAKVASPLPYVSHGNRHKHMRDDTSGVVRDRKVRISDEASLYSLCRSWLRNGIHEEIQPLKNDCPKPLPRPLPEHMVDVTQPKKNEDEDEQQKNEDEEQKNEMEEDGNNVEHLTAKDMLERHIKRAKRVRTRLREQRLKRIARYRNRLALLLPPFVE